MQCWVHEIAILLEEVVVVLKIHYSRILLKREIVN